MQNNNAIDGATGESSRAKKNRDKKWMKYRHRVVRNIAYVLLYPYCKLKYGVKIDKLKEQGERAYLILMNHTTPFDQFFSGIAFKGPVYYLATEDIFSKGWISSLIRWLVAPIPIKKQTVDISAIKTCMRVAKEGGTIGIAPEGNRTYSGKTGYMNPSIAKLAKKLRLPIALFRIEGGYGAQPRWSDCVRKGRIHCYFSRVIEPEEYNALSDEELFDIIESGLHVDEGTSDGIFKSKKRAEYLERAIYVCPHCGLSEFESNGAEVECKKCHMKVTYGEDKRLTSEDKAFPFEYVTEWYDYQENYICSLDVTQYLDEPLYRDTASLSEVIVYKKKLPLRKSVSVCLYGDRITIDELVFPFDDVLALSLLGRNKLNIYHGKTMYQIKGTKRFNALKYVNIYYRYKNMKENTCGRHFLGI